MSSSGSTQDPPPRAEADRGEPSRRAWEVLALGGLGLGMVAVALGAPEHAAAALAPCGGAALLLALWQASRQRSRAPERAASDEASPASPLPEDALIAYLPDAVVTVGRDGVVTSFNRAAEVMSGFSAEEVVGAPFWELPLFGASQLQIVTARFEELRAGRVVPPLELELVRKDGTALAVEGRAVARPGAAVVALFRDLSSEAMARDERAALQQQLQQAQRLETVAGLAGGVAHDFNNVLTVIVGAAAILRDSPTVADEDREDAAAILRAAERGSTLTRQLLALSRRQVLRPDLWDAGEIVRELGKLLGRMLGEDVTLELDVSPGPARVHVDRAQLEQVVLNLAVNARDAMPGGGTLRLATTPLKIGPSGDARFPGAEPGDYVALRVEDDGVGMSPEVRERIFEPFYTTKAHQGTGLGLPVVRTIVEELGGGLAVDSAPGEGTTVTVIVPLAQPLRDEPAEAAPELVASTRVDGPRQLVLLVEDDPGVRSTVTRMLTSCHFEVLACPSPERAREVARREADRIDVVLSDIVMPGLNGLELVDRLREVGVRAPAAFMSGYGGHDLVDRLVLDESTLLVQKPFTRGELVEALERAMREGR